MSTWHSLTNEVLKKLRETQIGSSESVADDDYWQLIADYVNDAKQEVEDAWNWTDLRTTIEVTTTASTSALSLTGTTDRSKVLSVWDSTNKVRVRPFTHRAYNRYTYTGTANDAISTWYRRRGVDSSGYLRLELWPTPAGVYTYEVYCLVPQADFSDDSDTLNLAGVDRAIIFLAFAMALEERGDDGGSNAGAARARGEWYLSKAIERDMANLVGELQVEVV